MADVLRQMYDSRYITAYIEITADMILQKIYYGRYITADVLQQLYYVNYMMADVLRKIYYGRYVIADMLRTTKTSISRQIASARSSRLLCATLAFGTHRPKDSPGCFVCRKATLVYRKATPSKPHLYIIDTYVNYNIYMCVYMYTYINAHLHSSLIVDFRI